MFSFAHYLLNTDSFTANIIFIVVIKCIYIAFLRLFNMLPHIVFHLCVETEGLCLAVALADGLDDLQDIGSNRTVGAVVAVVVRAPEVVDQGVLDAALYMVRHVVVESLLHAQRHADGGGVAVVYALAVGGMLVHRVLALDDVLLRIGIGAEFPTQTALVQGTLVDVTYQIVAGFLS